MARSARSRCCWCGCRRARTGSEIGRAQAGYRRAARLWRAAADGLINQLAQRRRKEGTTETQRHREDKTEKRREKDSKEGMGLEDCFPDLVLFFSSRCLGVSVVQFFLRLSGKRSPRPASAAS